MKTTPPPTSAAARGMLVGIVLGSVASTWLFLATNSALAFVIVGLGAAVGLLAGALVDRRRRGSKRS